MHSDVINRSSHIKAPVKLTVDLYFYMPSRFDHASCQLHSIFLKKFVHIFVYILAEKCLHIDESS